MPRGGARSLRQRLSRCRRCHIDHPDGDPWPGHLCRDCCFLLARLYQDNAGKNYRIYGMTREEHVAMFIRQLGACAICRKIKKLVIDHDHATGRVRSLLCGKCNTAIGMLDEDSRAVRRAKTYLAEHA